MTIKHIDQLDLKGTYTYADYITWQFDEMVELIKGKIIRMSPAPRMSHQRVSNQLSFGFNLFFQTNKCNVFVAPFDVILQKTTSAEKVNTVVQPDICVICDETKLQETGCFGSPDLIIEILSPTTKKKDYNEKFNLYEENEVREYWLVDPSDKTAEIYVLENNEYELHQRISKDAPLFQSKIFDGLEIKWENIFEH